MPSLSAIRLALSGALDGIAGLPTILWEARAVEPSRPFVIFEHVSGSWVNATVDGSEVRASGYFVASVCTVTGGFTTQADGIADQIIAAFPPGRRLAGICITDATPLREYFDGVGWRQPVRVDYRSEEVGAVSPPVDPEDDW